MPRGARAPGLLRLSPSKTSLGTSSGIQVPQLCGFVPGRTVPLAGGAVPGGHHSREVAGGRQGRRGDLARKHLPDLPDGESTPEPRNLIRTIPHQTPPPGATPLKPTTSEEEHPCPRQSATHAPKPIIRALTHTPPGGYSLSISATIPQQAPAESTKSSKQSLPDPSTPEHPSDRLLERLDARLPPSQHPTPDTQHPPPVLESLAIGKRFFASGPPCLSTASPSAARASTI